MASENLAIGFIFRALQAARSRVDHPPLFMTVIHSIHWWLSSGVLRLAAWP
jgi:hypothetical protein